jgi:acyl carrier protein
MQSSAALEAEIRTFLVENFPMYDQANLDRDQSLVESGVIDSLGILELVEFVETRFDLQIPEDELLPENLDSIANLSRYLSDKLRNDGAGADDFAGNERSPS